MFLSIQYKMETIEFEFDNDIEDNIIEQLADFVRDNDVFKPQPCNHFVDQEEIFHKYIDPSLMPVFQGFILETRLDSLIPLINKDF